jgi:hypothetical protein
VKKEMLIVIILAALFGPCFGWAQANPKKENFGLSLSGYIKTDLIYDSRQTVNIREGHFLLFPKAESFDPDGRDINAKSNFNMLSIQTRLVGMITGPQALGAKTSGLVEAEFFGHSDQDINGFRMRHAYVKLNWHKTELLAGQFWHAMFITDCFPDVISFNTGAPFQPFSRNPQVRLTRQFEKFSLVATAMTQRDFVSSGPEGASSAYLRNAVLPELNLKCQYVWKNERNGHELLCGIGVDYLKLVPRLSTNTGYRADEAISNGAGMAYAKYTMPDWTFKCEGIYGQNLYHLTMLGGYAVHDMMDAVRQDFDYTGLKNFSLWAEAHTNGEKFQAGLFAGYSKNLGSKETVDGEIYSRGFTIDSLYRIAPRAFYNSGKLRLAGEIEWTAAAYGAPDNMGVVMDAKLVPNLRLLGAVYYFF